MIDLPEATKLRSLRENLRKGTVFWFLTDDLYDPALQIKGKFGVVLSRECENDEIIYALTTSRLDRYQDPRRAADALRIPVGNYPFFTKETIVQLREVFQVDLAKLSNRWSAGEFERKGELSSVHVQEIDRIIRASRLIDWRQKVRCLSQ